jgi:hypothetical protein
MAGSEGIDFDLSERIADLVDMGLLEADTKEFAVAQEVIRHGEHALTPAQLTVWQKGVIPLLEETLSDEELFMQHMRKDQQADHGNQRHYRYTVQRYHFDDDGLSLEAPGERVMARTAKDAAEEVLGHAVTTRGSRSELAVKVYRVSDDFKPIIDIFYHPHSR